MKRTLIQIKSSDELKQAFDEATTKLRTDMSKVGRELIKKWLAQQGYNTETF